MPNVNQIYGIVNKIAEQSLGMTGLTETDTSFVSIGKKVFESDENVEAFYKVLTDVIGRTVVAVRPYNPNDKTLKREPFEMGAILQKISFKQPKAVENPTWYSVSQNAAPLNTKYPLTIQQMLFSDLSTWEVPLTIPDVQLKTAFRNAENMAAFFAGEFTVAQNSLNTAYENMGNLARASFMGACMISGTTTQAVNLLSQYNTLNTATLTVAEALRNKDFLLFSAEQIKNYSDFMESNSVTFNASAWERHTPKDKQVIEVLAHFSSAIDMNLQSSVFHNEITKLPYYQKINFWQGSGTEWKFEDASSINVSVEVPDTSTNAAENATKTQSFTKSGIVACIRDIDSVGITIDNRRTKSFYDPHNELTNYWHKADINYYRDMSENGVVFYLEETSSTT